MNDKLNRPGTCSWNCVIGKQRNQKGSPFLSVLVVSGLAIAFLFSLTQCGTIQRQTDSRPITHEKWEMQVKEYVREDGLVDYAAWQQDTVRLNAYLDQLSAAHPNEEYWTREERMAYWINAYNAFTIQLILRHYPVESIKDIQRGIPYINSVWDIKFITIQGYEYDLNNIEHNILRPVFEDARIHAAINCASYSCPKLRREAYTADRLDQQLDDAMRSWVNDPARNRINPPAEVQLSSIFNGFSGDFKRDADSIRAYVNRYAETPIPEEMDIDYLTYDWSLNDIP